MRNEPWKDNGRVKILKAAFLVSVLLYIPVVFEFTRLPSWSAPWISSGPGGDFLAAALSVMGAFGWAAGSFLGRGRPGLATRMFQAQKTASAALQRFVVCAALIESGAVFGVALSFISNDARPGLAASAISFALLLLLPASSGG